MGLAWRTLRESLALMLSILFLIAELALPTGADGGTEEVPAEPAEPAKGATKYMILVDAGSSGSRVHVYEYTWAGGDAYPVFNLPDKKLKTKPGLSSFKDNPTKAGESLQKLMEFAKEAIPAASHASTAVLVSATAGLRAIPPEKASAILDNCYNWLRRHTSFNVNRKGVALLSGKDEGALGWLSLNFLAKRLPGMERAKDGTLAGVEMGGASAQVTFERAVPHNADGALQADASDTAYELALGARRAELYTHSYLGFGQEKAREQVSARLPGADDPCLRKGFARAGDAPAGASVYVGRAVGPVKGSGNFAACRALVAELFQGGPACKVPPCSFAGVHQPDALGRLPLVAWENFFHTARAAAVPGLDSGRVTARALEEAGAAQCAAPHAAEDEAGDTVKLCFSLAFLSVFLRDGLGVPADKEFRIAAALGGSDIEWVLGQALSHAMAAPAAKGGKGGAAAAQPPAPYHRGVHLAWWGWAAAAAGSLVVLALVRSASATQVSPRDMSGADKDVADEVELGLLEEGHSKIVDGGQPARSGSRGVEVRKR